jgi:hypothetical protein
MRQLSLNPQLLEGSVSATATNWCIKCLATERLQEYAAFLSISSSWLPSVGKGTVL